MTDTVMTILGIVLAVLIMFILPVVAIAGQHDEISQATVETVVADFVAKVAEQGKITEFDYNSLIQKLNSTGNVFDIQIELQLMDDNPERKTVTTSNDSKTKGDNLRYSVYTENITEKIEEQLKNGKEGEYNLKKDDYIIVTVKNKNVTIGTQFKNFFYKIIGKDAFTIGASSSALVINSGKNISDNRVAGGFVDEKEEEDVYVELVTLTYVTNPLEYPKYEEGASNWYLKAMNENCIQYNAVMTRDLSKKQVSVPKGETVNITSEQPLVSGNGIQIKFLRWMLPQGSAYRTMTGPITVNEDMTIFAYYGFYTPGGGYIWDKPILYFYPTEETKINVKVRYEDRLTVSYPKYNSNGWEILAQPDGTLTDLTTNRELYCLYYEANNAMDPCTYKDGFIVKGEDSAKFLEEKLAILGLTEREAEEFIIYWLPKLESNKYNYIRFAEQDYINDNMPLDINPKPDTLIRVLMEFKGLEEPIDIEEQQLVSPVREGYTVVEWGGTEIKD